jgi:hypothetical protein
LVAVSKKWVTAAEDCDKIKRVGRKMAGMYWHVGFLRSARATLEVVFRYIRRQINRRINIPLPSLKVELHEPPLALRRTQHQIEFTAKCKAEARDNIDLHLDIGQIIMAPFKTTEDLSMIKQRNKN